VGWYARPLRRAFEATCSRAWRLAGWLRRWEIPTPFARSGPWSARPLAARPFSRTRVRWAVCDPSSAA